MPDRQRAPEHPERQRHYLMQLPQRLGQLRRQGERLRRSGWDINMLHLLAGDAGTLAGVCRAAGITDLADDLQALHAATDGLIEPPHLPDRATATRLGGLIERITPERLPHAVRASTVPSLLVESPANDDGFPLLVKPPAQYWKRFEGLPAEARPRAATPVEVPPPAFEGAADVPTVMALPDRRSGDRRAAARDGDERRLLPLPELLRRVDTLLAAREAGARNGGLLVFEPEDRALLAEPGLRESVARFVLALAGDAEAVAADAAGRFLLLGPERDPDLLEAWALNLRDRIARESFGSEASPVQVVFEVGASALGCGARDGTALLEATRRAIDNALAVGRHGVFVLRDLAALVDADLVEQLRLALAGSGLDVLFQPIMPLHGEEHPQFQALLRLRGKGGQLHVAGELIPAAEQAGLLGAVDRWVLQHCVARLAATPVAASRPRLFVSQSLASVREPHAADRLRELLEANAVDASCIVVELRSNDVLGAPGEVRHFAAAAQAGGAALSLSGFGNATDMRLLDALTPNYVKLDVDLLQRSDANANEDLRLLVDGLHERGVRVIAPCVEEASAVATLWSSGADYIQGNFVQAADRGFAFDFGSAAM